MVISKYEIFTLIPKIKILFLCPALFLLAILSFSAKPETLHYQSNTDFVDNPCSCLMSNNFTVPLQSHGLNYSSFQDLAIPQKAFFIKILPVSLLYINILLLAILIMARKSLSFARERFLLEGIINKRTEELLSQKEKVDELLSNMLPKDTANQLKKTGKATTKKFDLVSILFSDIEGFTRIAEQMNPEMLVDELDKFFFKFDTLVEEFNIEKIKTIGDAYMAAGGIPDMNRTNPIEVVMAAIRIMQYMQQLKKEKEYFWDLRIGIHSGPVIAGVVGQKKFSYDIWGDSVNTASRMESSGEAGKINISGSTYEYVKNFFICEYRGKMPVKYKGNIDMYFVKCFRPEFSVDMKGQEPNEQFFIKLQLLRLQDIEEKYIKKMEEELPAILLFHNLKYCIDLLTQCEILFNSEKLSDENRLLVRTAALFECMSYSKGYTERNDYIYQLSRELLPKYHYSDKQIEKIRKLINTNFIPPEAGTLPEKILSDARLAFLGKKNLSDSLNKLYEEKRLFGQAPSRIEFLDNIIQFLHSFKFYTITANKLSEVPVKFQIEKLLIYKEQPVHEQMKI